MADGFRQKASPLSAFLETDLLVPGADLSACPGRGSRHQLQNRRSLRASAIECFANNPKRQPLIREQFLLNPSPPQPHTLAVPRPPKDDAHIRLDSGPKLKSATRFSRKDSCIGAMRVGCVLRAEIGGMLMEWGIVNTLHEGKPAAVKGGFAGVVWAMCRWIVVARGISGVCAASPRLVNRESAVDDRWATYLSWGALAVTVAAEDRRNILSHFGSAILPNYSSTFFLFLAAWGRRRTGEALGRLARGLWLYFSSGRAAAHCDFDHVVIGVSGSNEMGWDGGWDGIPPLRVGAPERRLHHPLARASPLASESSTREGGRRGATRRRTRYLEARCVAILFLLSSTAVAEGKAHRKAESDGRFFLGSGFRLFFFLEWLVFSGVGMSAGCGGAHFSFFLLFRRVSVRFASPRAPSLPSPYLSGRSGSMRSGRGSKRRRGGGGGRPTTLPSSSPVLFRSGSRWGGTCASVSPAAPVSPCLLARRLYVYDVPSERVGSCAAGMGTGGVGLGKGTQVTPEGQRKGGEEEKRRGVWVRVRARVCGGCGSYCSAVRLKPCCQVVHAETVTMGAVAVVGGMGSARACRQRDGGRVSHLFARGGVWGGGVVLWTCVGLKDETRRNEMLLHLFLLCVKGTSGRGAAAEDTARGAGKAQAVVVMPRVLAAAAVVEGENQEQARRQPRATGWFCCRMQDGGEYAGGDDVRFCWGAFQGADAGAGSEEEERRGRKTTVTRPDKTRGSWFVSSRRTSEARSEEGEGTKDSGRTGRESRVLGVGQGEMRARTTVVLTPALGDCVRARGTRYSEAGTADASWSLRWRRTECISSRSLATIVVFMPAVLHSPSFSRSAPKGRSASLLLARGAARCQLVVARWAGEKGDGPGVGARRGRRGYRRASNVTSLSSCSRLVQWGRTRS
ncbi:hypothetical protein B0H14DRAFT_3558778 [Mycena olivaceomarginata]|nr:hypothetical protein B0H14DRAFT_3558778 [Mycena olivaceomarginata]